MKLSLAGLIKRHHVSRAALSLGVLVTAVLFFLVGAVLRLVMGPLSLGPVSAPLRDAIARAMPGINLQYDEAAIEWTRDQGRMNLVVLGARLVDSGGRVVVRAPKADIDLAAGPLLMGRAQVQRITLVGVELALTHTRGGAFRLGSASNPSQDDIIARIGDIINANDGGTSSLKSFAVRDARLAIYDEPLGLSVRAPRAALSIRGQGPALEAEFNADVEISGRHAKASARLLLPPRNGPVSGELSVTGLDLRALAANTPKFAALKNLALTTSLTSHFAFAADGRLARADFDASASGQVPLTLLKGGLMHVNSVRLLGRYDGIARHLTLDTGELDSRELKTQFKGNGALAYAPDGKLLTVSGDLAAVRLAVDAPGVFARPVTFQTLSLNGSYAVAEKKLDVGKAVLTAPALSLQASGALTFVEGLAPGMVMNGTVAALPMRTLLTYWPLSAAPGAREWIAGNIFAGNIGPARFQTNFTPGGMDAAVIPTEALRLEFGLRGIEANYLTGLTHLTGVNGSGLLTGDDFTADFTGGRVGNLVVRSGRAVIPALHLHGTVGTFALQADGAMTEIMTLIDMKPLGYPTRFGIDPRQTRGAATVDMSFRVPMLPDLPVDDVGISVKATVNGFAATLGKLALRDGAVTFDIDNNRLRQSGSALLADQRFNFDWTEDFKTGEAVTSRINARGLLTPAVRALLNIDIGKVVTGNLPVNAAITGRRGALLQADANLDLTPAVITIPILNLGKAAGEAASGRVTVNFGANDTVSDEVIRVTGPGLAASGTATFDKAGALSRLDFSSLRMGINDLGFTLTRSANGGDIYDLHGRVLDGSHIGRKRPCNAPPGPAGAEPPDRDDTPQGAFRVMARLDRLALCENVSIAPFTMDMSGVGERPGALTLSGSLSRTAPITAGLENTAQGRKVTITAGDAGLLARGLFAFDGLRGGALTITATLPGRASDIGAGGNAPDFTGTMTVNNFKVVNQPFLARLFSAVSLTGIGDLLQNDGISMDKMTVPFSSKNSVISVNNAVFTGNVGVTADGYIDRPKNQVAMKGSLVPAYGINSLISNVPLLGDLLASKKGEGILGVTYSLTGNTDQPNLSVNPLSMLTPGILRRLFEGRMPSAANAPSNQPTPN